MPRELDTLSSTQINLLLNSFKKNMSIKKEQQYFWQHFDRTQTLENSLDEGLTGSFS